MPIKWSALQVLEAMDMVEEYYSQLMEPMEQAELVVRQAHQIPNLPQYISQALGTLLIEIERVKGGVMSYSGTPYPARIKACIDRIRENLPADDLKRQKRRTETEALV